ncbi:hypothetical protein QC823_11875 [Halomonas vilamensis]|uniref:Uncharacterized protein n=1 Tax=Vreelandella vilamensis TaxID=531309 RepID=A0ABU1H842_9GAMM|nr:hypothetical protein [Halomonas vilamensis]MDR5899683.1 hypothetical protein [Halomonas vilamensis]
MAFIEKTMIELYHFFALLFLRFSLRMLFIEPDLPAARNQPLA